MNDQGDHTGAKSSSWAVTTGIMYVAPFQILGARYAAFIRGLGYADLSITTPKQAGAKTYDRIGLIDPEFISMNLSWNIGGHVFVSSKLGFVPPIGQYSKTAALNIGQGHWALLPGAAISWLPKNYQMTLQGVLVKNYQNADTHYTNGTTIDFDATAIRRAGAWSFGPVGYYYKQITADSGPLKLNAGSPEEIALGGDVSYNAGRFGITGILTHDVLARNMADSAKFVVSISIPIE